MKGRQKHYLEGAILAVDAVGYSRLMARDEEATVRRLHTYRGLIQNLATKHGGRVFGVAGDSEMAVFADAADAVRCALDIQDAIEERNALLPKDSRMPVRIGINYGQVIVEDDIFFGDDINVAARLESFAEAGAILTVCCAVSGTAVGKGKPQALDPVSVNIVGGLQAAEDVESHEVSVSGGKNNRVLEVVVRDFDVTFVFGRDSGMEDFDTCFDVSDAGAAGKFTFDNEGDVILDAYPEYLDKNGDPQLYQLNLDGTHDDAGDVSDFPASGSVSVTADFGSIQVSTEGRGKHRNACTGTFHSTDGFGAEASFDRP